MRVILCLRGQEYVCVKGITLFKEQEYVYVRIILCLRGQEYIVRTIRVLFHVTGCGQQLSEAKRTI